MTLKMMPLCGVAAFAVLVPVVAHAHVSVWPRESSAGATERYTVRVPTEGKVYDDGCRTRGACGRRGRSRGHAEGMEARD